MQSMIPKPIFFTITYNTIYTHLKKASRNRQLLNTIINHLAQIQNTTEDTVVLPTKREADSQAIHSFHLNSKLSIN